MSQKEGKICRTEIIGKVYVNVKQILMKIRLNFEY